uniref:alpha/beta fold hydrolase n=1 Tax=Acetatifactor sp. TaxID=1872090 RepID=UPI0040578003
MPYVSFKDLKLYYEDLGRGEPVLFLHSGFSRGILAFGAQIQPFQGKYRCIFPDFRGHGRTICEDLTWDTRRIADDMIEFMDVLEIKRVHLFAYSMGASVGMYMSSKYPERVCSLVAIGASSEPVPDGAEDFLPENLIAKNDIATIEDMKVRHYEAHRGDWQTYMRQTVADWLNHPKLSKEEWAAIKCPVLFIKGEQDIFSSNTELKKKCPHAVTHEVPGGGHRPHFVMEQGKEINKLVLDFLEQLE